MILDLSPGEAQHGETPDAQSRISCPVGLERGSCSVRLPAVNFHNETLLPPEEIDAVAVDANVHFRLGKAVTTGEGEEEPLEVRTGAVWLEGVPNREL
jgi:hypothetical protein